MTKSLSDRYCEAVFPFSIRDQRELSYEIQKGDFSITDEEMEKELVSLQKEMENRNNLYNELFNYKFESALQYIPGSNLLEKDEKLIRSLNKKFGNPVWISDDFMIIINAALCSLPHYNDLTR